MTLNDKEQKLDLNRQLTNLRMQWFAGDKLIGQELLRIDPIADMDLPEWGEYVDELADYETELRKSKYTLLNPPTVRIVQESRK